MERVVEFRFFLRRVKRAQVSSSDVVFYDLCRALESINGVIAVICKELDVNDCFNDVEKFEDSLDCQNCAPLDQAKPNLVKKRNWTSFQKGSSSQHPHFYPFHSL